VQVKNKVGILLFGLSLFSGGSISFAQQTKPNILFILTDDLGYTDLGAYGNPYHETPHLDSMASHGVKFLQAYSASPVCSPSRVAMLTGKHPARVGLTNFLVGERKDKNWSVDPPADWTKGLESSGFTLVEYLKTKGYQTGFVGKWLRSNESGKQSSGESRGALGRIEGLVARDKSSYAD
jgi:arylsulfatase A